MHSAKANNTLKPQSNGRPICMAQTALLSLLCIYSSPARAALGESVGSTNPNSLQSRAVQSSPAIRFSARPGYSILESTLPSGAIIQEFVSSAGVIFAVSWHGPLHPDFRQLFGRYFTQYSMAPRLASSNRSRLQIDQPDLVVQAGGHMRAFAGVAFVPRLMPAGVTAGDLK